VLFCVTTAVCVQLLTCTGLRQDGCRTLCHAIVVVKCSCVSADGEKPIFVFILLVFLDLEFKFSFMQFFFPVLGVCYAKQHLSEVASIFLAVIWRGIAVCRYASHSVSEMCLFRCTVCQGSSVEDFGTPLCIRATNLVLFCDGAPKPQ